MAHDDKSSVVPLSMTPETEVIDESWDEDDAQLEVLPPEEAEPDASDAAELELDLDLRDRPTPFLGEELLESGFHEREAPTEPSEHLSPPRVPVFDSRSLPESLREREPPMLELDLPRQPAPRRPPSAELDDPLAHMDADLDSDTPSDHPLPIEQRVTPVHDPPADLLGNAPTAPPEGEDDQDPAVRDMKERYAVGDFTGALVIAESVLEADPQDAEARRYAQSCRDVLMQMYAARLGSLDQIVTVAIPSDQIRWLSLDHRAGFLLSLVDGSSSLEELLDICGMLRLDALRILFMLLEQRVIALK